MATAEIAALVAAGLRGAEAEIARTIELDDDVMLTIVVNIAWASDDTELTVGSAIPDGHGRGLLAEGLRQSANEAEECL